MSEKPDAAPAAPGAAGRRALAAAAAAVAVAYVALTVWAAPTFRGSDQYWYVEDTVTLMRGGPAVTHELFPFSLTDVDPHRAEPTRPFVHNVPVLRVWAAAGRLLGSAENGILAVNVLGALLGALFVHLTARRFAGEWVALVAAAAFLFVPVAFWVTSQAAAEPFSAMLVAAALWLATGFRGRPVPLMAGQLLLALAAAGRIWALPYLALLPLAALVFGGSASPRARAGWAAGALALGAAAYVLLSRAFPNYMPPLDPMVVLEVARTNNMVMYYRLEPAPALDIGVLLREGARNALTALKVQFDPGRAPFNITRFAPWADRWPVNVLALVAVAGTAWRGVDRERRFMLALGVAGWLVHLGMAVVYLNQPRYVVVVLAPIAVAAAVVFDLAWRGARLSGRRTAAAALVAVLALGLAVVAGVDVGNAIHYRRDSLAQRERREAADAFVDSLVPADARVVLDSRFDARWDLDWAVSPRPELPLTTTFPYDDATYRELVREFGARYLVADSTSRLPALLGAERLGASGDVTVWRLAP